MHFFHQSQNRWWSWDTNTRIPTAKPSFYTICRISFSRSCCIEKSAVQVYISPSLFITENENTKQTCEWSYETRNTKKTEVSIPIAHAVYWWGRLNISCMLRHKLRKGTVSCYQHFLSVPGKARLRHSRKTLYKHMKSYLILVLKAAIIVDSFLTDKYKTTLL
jgi:hypothetical protein